MVLSLEDVRAAARRLEGVAHRTPVLTSRTLDEMAGARVFLKAENLQRSGAFKFRGAYNKLASLGPAERERGVVAFSSGNHAGAVALAARLLGVTAVIVMPADAPAAKVEATRGYGATIVTYDRYAEDREEVAAAVREERDMVLVPPFDDPLVMAGQGTAALELFDEVGSLDALVVPVSGGGLMAGSAVVAAAQPQPVRVIGVEPEAGDDTRQSLVRGERVTIPVPRTIADGLAVVAPGRLSFEVNRRLVSEVVVVSDDQLVAAMALAFDRMKIVIEPSGAAGLAAVLAGAGDGAGRGDGVARIGVILSGGNVGVDRFVELVGRRAPSA